MILQGVNPVLQMIFTFMQMYFIFMNSRVRKFDTTTEKVQFFKWHNLIQKNKLVFTIVFVDF